MFAEDILITLYIFVLFCCSVYMPQKLIREDHLEPCQGEFNALLFYFMNISLFGEKLHHEITSEVILCHTIYGNRFCV